MIRWVFLDAGNLIFNDDPLMAFVYGMIYEEIHLRLPEFIFEDLMAEAERLIMENQYGDFRTLGLRFLDEKSWKNLNQKIQKHLNCSYPSLNPPLPGAKEMLYALNERYKLALAANQIRACRDSLKRHGLLSFFSILGISEEMGVSKPDPVFFLKLLGMANCSPGEAVMIGDRIDNDIVPAKKLGMRTIRVKLSSEKKGFSPQTDYERAYLESLNRTNLSLKDPEGQVEKPDLTIADLGDIPLAVERLGKSLA
jgi:HAD superfamily hydrolase (TIGR01509 family)